MIFNCITTLTVISALVTVVSFILYVKARTAEKEAKEQLYKSVHFTSLFIFVVLGVLILVILSNQASR